MSTLLQFDTSLFLWLNRPHCAWADLFFYYISTTWIWIPLYLLLSIFLLKKWGKEAVAIFIIVALVILTTDQTCNLLKNNVQRLRPSHTEAIAHQVQLVTTPSGAIYYGGQFGFPSAHGANTMAVGFIIFSFITFRKKWVVALVLSWVFLVSYSRIYLGVHYPLDILCGWILGACISLFWIWCYKKTIHVWCFAKK